MDHTTCNQRHALTFFLVEMGRSPFLYSRKRQLPYQVQGVQTFPDARGTATPTGHQKFSQWLHKFSKHRRMRVHVVVHFVEPVTVWKNTPGSSRCSRVNHGSPSRSAC
jgi:hypothetical protein